MSHWTPKPMLDENLDKGTKLTIAIIECTFRHTNSFDYDIFVFFL